MIGRLAVRSLTAHPVRSAVLAAGFGVGVAVMAILLGVADVVLTQARSADLVGGGDVVIHMTAAGAPGPHIIDFYPGIYQGPQDQAQQLYRLPMLTYADDHPGNHIPALRFMFEVIAGKSQIPNPKSQIPTSSQETN